MKIQAEISIYPLRIKNLSEPVEEYCGVFREHGLEITTTSMSTQIIGESRELFRACDEAFEQLTHKYEAVMNMKISNACPLNRTD